jgi:putative (di)nucleoside polyphosphate hydrolase
LIDSEGFRHNVGIIICNRRHELFWGRRIGQNAWQFPQGGMNDDETPEEAMYRELKEEVGLTPNQVKIIGRTADWLHYRLPQKYVRKHCQPLCIGQKQIWFLLEATCADNAFDLTHTDHPEFEEWRWIKYWQPIKDVIHFKRSVYSRALRELAPLLGTKKPSGNQRANYLRQNRR